MAVEIVAGSALNAFLSVLFDRIASPRFVDFFRHQKLSDQLLQKLETAMCSIRGVLDDAEEKEISKPVVKQWLDKLKNAFYEADDLLDEIDYEATRLEFEAQPRSVIGKVRKFLCSDISLKNGLEARLMQILETMEDLVNQKSKLGLTDITGDRQSVQRADKTSIVDTSSIFGRERDQEAIMELLLSDDVDRSNNLGIISIVGMGGIGKTTLAQLIYADERVQDQFDITGWVCVSEYFDVPRITRDILKEISSKACDDKTLNQIHVELKKTLTGKRFLLVLDDAWHESSQAWDDLLEPLKYGSPASKIIVTTRNNGVASAIPFSSIFRLDVLTSTDSWQLFCKHAFETQNCHDYPDLEEIGKKIVKKCYGLPLAVKLIGGVLRSKKNLRDWENVLNHDMWTCFKRHILPVLRLSYYYLPPHLKQCFAYCSLFSKNYEFEKDELIPLWMAEGFLIPQGTKAIEKVGEEYLDELVSRSLFQLRNNFFVMHNLINDLARDVAGEFCFRFESQNFGRTSKRLRYFSYVVEEHEPPHLLNILKSHHLRTFLTVYESHFFLQHGEIWEEVIPYLFLNQQRLRVLSFSGNRYVVVLPNSIGQLKHLRYLDLSKTSIRSLPEWLCSLYNLHTLKLGWCRELAELPTKMGRLINLRHLDIDGTRLREMPPNMGKLTNLQNLTDFYVGKREGCRLKELGSLQQLRGKLRIHNLQNVVNAKASLEAQIKCKKYLKELELVWEGDTDDTSKEKTVLDGLEPHTEIEAISIIGYGGTSFPNWLGDSSFTKLSSLTLIECKYCYLLPPLGQISSLKYLKIRGFKDLRRIGSGFYGNGVSPVKPFQSLEIIWIEDMPQLQEWRPYGREGETGAFSCLKELYVMNCPNLKGSLPTHLPSLTTLQIHDSPQLQNWVPIAPNLSSIVSTAGKQNSLNIDDFPDSVGEKFDQFVSYLKEFTPFTPKFFPLDLFPKLRNLEIQNRENFESFGTVNQEFEFLTSLHLIQCPRLKFLPERMQSLLPALSELVMNRCQEIETFPRDGLPLKLKSLKIHGCNKLIAGRAHWNLQKFTSLISFSIGEYEEEEMESFPEVTLLPSILTTLRISDLPNLKSLNFQGLQHLSSLKSWTIEYCPRLQLVSDDGFLSSLNSIRELRIRICPQIESLPEGLPPTLITLDLSFLQNLRSVEGLRHLTSLESLTIEDCPLLKSLPEEGWPSSLSSIRIRWCPLLKERYGSETGNYWAKDSQNRSIDIEW